MEPRPPEGRPPERAEPIVQPPMAVPRPPVTPPSEPPRPYIPPRAPVPHPIELDLMLLARGEHRVREVTRERRHACPPCMPSYALPPSAAMMPRLMFPVMACPPWGGPAHYGVHPGAYGAYPGAYGAYPGAYGAYPGAFGGYPGAYGTVPMWGAGLDRISPYGGLYVTT